MSNIRLYTPNQLLCKNGKLYKYIAYSYPKKLKFLYRTTTHACHYCGVYDVKLMPTCLTPYVEGKYRCNLCIPAHDGYWIRFYPEKISLEKVLYYIYYNMLKLVITYDFFILDVLVCLFYIFFYYLIYLPLRKLKLLHPF